MRKKILASLLAAVMLVSLLPTSALATQEDEVDSGTTLVCTEKEGCILEAGHGGECVTAPDEPEKPVDDSAEEATDPVGPTAEEQLAELIEALPDPEEIDSLDEEQVEAVYEQIAEIYAFAEENSLDVEDNETVNAVIAALHPAEPLANTTYIDDNADQRTLSGSGTESDPYLISSVDDLDKIRYYIVSVEEENSTDTSGNTTTINNQVIDGYFKLDDNIDLTDNTNWTPIGITEENKAITYKTAFVGTFDGNNKTISNLTISDNEASGLGLFTRLGAGSVVKDLTLDNCAITGANSTYQDFGALAGRAVGTTIKNIKLSNITVSGNSRPAALVGDFIDGSTLDGCVAETLNISGNNQVGGIFGRTHNTAKNTIKNCSVTGATVTLNSGATGNAVAGLVAMCIGSLDVNDVSIVNTKVSGTSYVGGIVGSTTAQMTMDHCTVDSASSISGTNLVGGMIGNLQPNQTSSIQNCSSSAEVNGTVCAGGLVGALQPTASAEIKNSYATGSVTVDSSQVTGNDAKNSVAGGLIGKVTSSTSGVVPCVDTCYATGNVSALSTAYVGGLIGSLTGTVKNSHASGTVTGIAAGGLVGFMNHTSTVPTTVDGCYATGTVTATGDAGGLIGRADGAGTIQNSYSTGEVSSTGTVGGLVGWMRSVTLDKVATTGNVTHTSPATADTYAGGLAGFAGQNNSISCTIKNAVVNNNVSGDSAYAFINITQGTPTIENCYVNTSSSNPFIYYQAQLALKNCFYAGNVSGVQVVDADSYYAKMDFSDITGSYGDTLTLSQTNTIGTSVTSGTAPEHTLSVVVLPESLISVGDDGTLTAAGVGSGTLSLVLTVNEKDFVFGTANITISAKSVNVTMVDKTEAYDGSAKTIEATADADTTLPSDLTLVYSYSSDTGSTYDSIPPSAPGTYTVKVESGNANYTLTGTTTATLTISAPTEETDVSNNATVTEPASLVYDGAAKAYTAVYEGITEWSIIYYDADGNKLESAPVNAGNYTVTINGDSESVYASITKEFSITPAALTITPKNKTAYVGDTLPTLGENDYTVTGLVGNDTLSKAPTLAYDGTPDMNTANTYAIKASGAEAGDNYTITYVNGTLTVQTKPTYTVSFESKYSTAPVAQTVNSGDKITLIELTAEGYTHTGWVDGDGQTYTTTAEVEIKKDMTFTAVWGETLTEDVEHLSDDPVVSTSEPSNATQEEKNAISDTANKVKSLTETGLSNAVDTQKTSIVDAAKETEAYKTFASSNSGNGTTITVVITSYMSIQVTGASISDSQKSVTMDITPMYKVEATTASNTSGMTEANTAALVSATELPVANGNNVVISMPVPSIFASSTNLYAKHIKGNTTYVYKVTVTGSGDSARLSFTNPHGFSTFVLTDTTAASITADGTTTYYATLQEAVDAVGNGQTIKLEANNSEAVTVGRTVTFTLDQNGKTFSGSVSGASRTSVTESNGTYTCVYSSGSSGGGGGSSSSSYAVSVDSTRNGTVKSNRTSASKGTTVTLTVTPKDGYELDELTVTDKNGDTVKLTRKSDTQYTFTMPASKVTVEASFVKIEAEPDEGLPFVDVAESAYYYDAVLWAVENGITGGTSATTFSPNQACTRAQAMTFLWRAAGSPAPKTTSNPFTDVSSSAYYYDAVLWAVENGITAGTSATTFSPNNTCTRGQIMTFLWRADGSPASSGSSFADVSADAYYADAVAWAVAESITAGTSATTFGPGQSCTRAQIMTFLYRANA